MLPHTVYVLSVKPVSGKTGRRFHIITTRALDEPWSIECWTSDPFKASLCQRSMELHKPVTLRIRGDWWRTLQSVEMAA